MNKKLFFLLLGFLVTITISVWACQKDGAEKAQQNAASELATSDRNAPPANIRITCKGSCKTGEHPDPAESTCEAMPYDRNTGTLECPCSDCAMQFTAEMKLVSPFLKHFNQHLTETIGTAKTVVYGIEVQSNDTSIAVLFEYKIPGETEKGTVLYTRKTDQAGNFTGPSAEINCTGTCDKDTETCRERYYLATGIAECTCEGNNCKMTYKVLKD